MNNSGSRLDKTQTQLELKKLITKFQSNRAYYESNDYLERQLQTDFIDDFFKSLEWDITNKANLSPRQREVLVEKGETKGRPDYTFRVDGLDKFFVEVKSPHRGTDRPDDIFQAKSYGYSTKSVTIAILTDFITFKVFDSGIKPNIKQPKQGLLFETSLEKMAEEDFEKIWIFQHNEVHRGSIEQLLQEYPALKRLRVPVDVTFLEQLTRWREELAKNIYKNNPDLSVRSLNDVVQRLLDRLIFIRLIEDREIIKSRRLKEISDIWKESRHRDLRIELDALFKKLNNDFNGEIFKPHDCENKQYDSKIVSDIIDELYPPESPYDFSVMPVELLGIIYEKYLGSTIRLTEKRLKVEEKPEVRKAGGVFYTPKWVVDYIVENTVGELIQGKTPEQISQLRFLDPACGSGSFLIGTLNKLFDYHLGYYLEHRKEAKEGTLFPKINRIQDSEPRLSIYAKSDILKNNIFGVDLDPQAVEITMMSLYIKALEGERALPENKELLPSLSNNIRCGNSLVDFDFKKQTTLTQQDNLYKINPFSWESKTEGFGKYGFDAIFGNPPYIRIQILKETIPEETDYFSSKYITAAKGNYDIYCLFVEKGISLLNENGMLGFILPNKFLMAEYGRNLRRLLKEKELIDKIISFGDKQVFDGATTYTCLLFLTKYKKNKIKYYETITDYLYKEINSITQKNFVEVYNNDLNDDIWIFQNPKIKDIMNKMEKNSVKLKDVCDRIFQGIRTSANEIYVLKKSNEKNYYSDYLNEEISIENGLLHKFVKGNEIRKWINIHRNLYVLIPYEIINNKASLISEENLKEKYPQTYEYLLKCKKFLENRENGKMKGPSWYGFVYPKNLEIIKSPKILTRDIVDYLSFSFDSKGEYSFVTGYGLTLPTHNYLYLLALLNSTLMNFYFTQISTRLRGGFYRTFPQYIEKLPIKFAAKEVQSELSDIVSRIIELNREKDELSKRELNILQEKLDEYIYNLYEINDEQKKYIEK